MGINIGSPGRRGVPGGKAVLDVSGTLAECDFSAYVGGNFKNLIPTRRASLSRLALSLLPLSLSSYKEK